MRKILIVAGDGLKRNGITGVILNTYDTMCLDGLQIDFAVSHKPDVSVEQRIAANGGRIYLLPRKGASFFFRLKRIIQAGKYDVVHVHGSSHLIVVELLAAALAGAKKRIAHSHNTTCRHPMLHHLLAPIFHCCYTDALACGDAAGRWMFQRRKFEVLHNGIFSERFLFDPQKREMVRQKLGYTDEIVIGHVGNFNQQKNHAFLIDFFHELVRSNPKHRLLLLGDGGLKEGIREKVEALSLEEAVHFAGNVENVPDYLQAMDCMVLPSLYEGLPLTLVEAQTAGLACLASDRVTAEADLTGLVTFLPLEDGVRIWREAIAKLVIPNRAESCAMAKQKVQAAGFDAHTSAERLRNLYTNG